MAAVEELWLEEGFETICDLANGYDSESDLLKALQDKSITGTDAEGAVSVWYRARTLAASLITEFVTSPKDRPLPASTMKSDSVTTSSSASGTVSLVGPRAVSRLKRAAIQVVALPSKHPKWHHRRRRDMPASECKAAAVPEKSEGAQLADAIDQLYDIYLQIGDEGTLWLDGACSEEHLKRRFIRRVSWRRAS